MELVQHEADDAIATRLLTDSVSSDLSQQGSDVRSSVFLLLNATAAESQSVLRFLHDSTGRVTLNRDPRPGQRAS